MTEKTRDFPGLAEALADMAEHLGTQLQMTPGAVLGEITMALGCLLAKYSVPEDPNGSTVYAVKHLPVIVALMRTHGGEIEKVRNDMLAHQSQTQTGLS